MTAHDSLIQHTFNNAARSPRFSAGTVVTDDGIRWFGAVIMESPGVELASAGHTCYDDVCRDLLGQLHASEA